MKLLKCSVCGNVVEMVEDKNTPIMCCGKAMEEVKANTTDGALEKHVPVAEVVDGNLHVKVGSMEHPMLPEHYITNIFVEFDNRIGRVMLNPGDKPEATICIGDYKGKIHVYEYCNLHGLWKTDIEI
ncbi:desulfoferrodoxin family protein [Amedibacillus sp. YH-ame10]